MNNRIPLSLYIHIPWCVRKCPYCDFNSHTAKDNLQEELYVAALIRNLVFHLPLVQDRPIKSIFFGGGTPSLFSGQAIASILTAAAKHLSFTPDIEITLEANPGTIDYVRFRDFYAAGVNRLSLGIQSFQNDKLIALGRIHDSEHAKRAIELAKQAGFENFNLDLMFGLPNQSIEEALLDLSTALSFQPMHLSWYQLTIEPNTLFHRQPPILPHDDVLWEMQQAGQQLLTENGLEQYEVSAYSKPGKSCQHNLNYWTFGDYLGIGAGAHSKMTDFHTNAIKRFSQFKNPKDYLKIFSQPAINHALQTDQIVSEDEVIFEFMLNCLRLTNGFSQSLFTERCGIDFVKTLPIVMRAVDKGLLSMNDDHIQPTEHGKKFLNNLIELFL